MFYGQWPAIHCDQKRAKRFQLTSPKWNEDLPPVHCVERFRMINTANLVDSEPRSLVSTVNPRGRRQQRDGRTDGWVNTRTCHLTLVTNVALLFPALIMALFL